MELILLLCVAGIAADSPKHYDTIVVGLGSAGATAASTLAAAGRRVLALDAQPRVGGRVHTVPFGDGIVELGAEWILGTKNSRTYDAATQHNITTIHHEPTSLAYHSDGSSADSELINQLVLHIFDAGPESPEAQGNFTTKKIIEDITKNKPQLLENQDLLAGLLGFVEVIVNNLEGSSDWNDVTTGGDYEDLDGYQSVSWHRLGYSTFFDILLNTYKDGPGLSNLEVKLNKEAMVIRSPQHPAGRVSVDCRDGSSYEADTAIVSVSLGVLKAKFIFIWKEADRKKVPASDHWTTKIMWANRPLGSSDTLTLWASGNIAKEVETLSEDTVKTKCVALLQRFLGDNLNITVPQPSAIIRTTWASNPYTRGSYTFDNILTPQYPDARDWLARPIADSSGAPRVLFAGEATSRNHFGTVHGASETGYREATRLLRTATKIITNT